MAETHRFDALVEAIADGRPLDWADAEASAATPSERAAIRALRDLSAIRHAYETLSGPSDDPRLRTVLPPGTSWGSLRVLEHVGRGRYGEVYRAWDPALDRHVALKLVEAADADPASNVPVVDEGRLMARVRHPNVVTVHGAQRLGDVAGLWMEFLEGRTLAAELADRGPFDADALLTVGRQLADALAAVHGAGLVHRDVKASNVIRDRTGRIVLGDFGTGFAPDDEAATGEGLIGTPAYLAPEIFGGASASPRSDVYSLGVLLFHLATGEYPHGAGSLGEIGAAHASGRVTSLADRRPDLPRGLSEVIDHALEPEPSRRYATGRDMLDALEGLGRGPAAKAVNRWVMAMAALAVAVVVGAAVWYPWAGRFQFRERDWVLVAAFENRTGNPLFDGAVEFALAQELGNSPIVNVVPRSRIEDTLALMRRPLDDRVDARTGQEIALRDGGIRAVLAGQTDLAGGVYRLTAEIHNPADGAMVASLDERAASDDDVLVAAGRLASKVRARLGETLPPLGQEMPRVTTRSLRALSLYQQALADLFPDANPRVAERLLAEAVREDPDFAVAHAALARAIWAQRLTVPIDSPSAYRSAEIDAHLEAAERASANVTVEDRYRIEAEAGAMNRIRADPAERQAHRKQALIALEALHRLRPDDDWVLHSLLELGDSRPERVLPLVERLVSLRPNSPYALVRAASESAQAEDFELARSYLARARPLLDLPTAERSGDHTAVNGRSILFDDAWVRDDVHEAAGVAEELYATWRRSSSPEAAALTGELIATKFLALGQLDRAEEIASSLIRSDGRRQQILASVAFSRQDPEAAREYLDENGIDPLFPHAWVFTGIYALAGRLEHARAAVARMRTAEQVPPDVKAWYEAQLALVEGQPERAIALLAPIEEKQPNVVRSNDLADAWLATGNAEEAIRVLERVPPRRYGLTPPHHWLAQQDRLARLYRQVGRAADADRVDARLRVLLTFADNDHPIKRRLRTTAPRVN